MHSAKCSLNMENHLHSHRYIYMIMSMSWIIVLKPFTGLDASLLLELQQMIKNVNPYAHKYLQVPETIAENPAGDIKLVLRSPGK